jgi:uncharacterized membrane protein
LARLLALPQHADQHGPKRPVLLAVDQQFVRRKSSRGRDPWPCASFDGERKPVERSAWEVIRDDVGGGWWIFGVVVMVACMYFMARMMMGHGESGHGAHGGRGDGTSNQSARDILAERFARGEISEEEFHDRCGCSSTKRRSWRSPTRWRRRRRADPARPGWRDRLSVSLPQHPDEHGPEHPVLLAVDQQLGEGAALRPHRSEGRGPWNCMSGCSSSTSLDQSSGSER